MKILILLASFVGSLAYADILLTPGSSASVGGQTVSCENPAPSTITYVCLCHNTGRTDNPRPQWISFQVTDANSAIAEGQRQCSQLNYGRPDFGFSPVDHCHPQ